MSTHAHVWLIWSGAFLLSFVLIFAIAPERRPMMLRAAAATMPFGLTEPLFVPDYWNPPSLFGLAQRTGFDLESLIFSFSIGGVAVVLYDWLTGQVRWNAGAHFLPPSLYLSAKPAFFGALPWPWVTPTDAQKTFTLPAKARFESGNPFGSPDELSEDTF